MKKQLKVLALMLGVAGLATSAAHAQDKVKIGFITDMSSLYADVEGKNGAVAIQMAIDDFGGKVLGMPIELLTADHQNKADIAASKAREWIDTQGLTMLFGGTNSGTALASAKVAAEKKRVYINNGAASSALTNDQCTPYTVHYAYDTVALAKGTGSAIVDGGGKSWYFLTADYAFGHALEADTTAVVKAKGGNVVGAVRHPLNASDFSSFLLQAQSSGAKVIGLANAGADTQNAIKQAAEFGITQGGQRLAALLFTLAEVHGLGLEAAQGLTLTEGFYWNRDEESQKFGKRFFERTGKMPNMIHTGTYSAVLQYLKAIDKAGTDETEAVAKQLHELPVDDVFAKGGSVGPNGRMFHDMYLLEVKKPGDSKEPWDYFNVLATIPGKEAYIDPAKSGCELVK